MNQRLSASVELQKDTKREFILLKQHGVRFESQISEELLTLFFGSYPALDEGCPLQILIWLKGQVA